MSSPFLRSDWFALWADAFVGEGQETQVVTWWQDGKPAAVLPLLREGVRHASLSNSHSDVFDAITPDGVDSGDLVCDWLARRPATRLYRLDGQSSLIPGSDDSGWTVMEESQSPYLNLVDKVGLRQAMGSNLSKNIDRLERKIGRLGELVYLDNADGDLPDAFERCMKLEAAGWKGEMGTAMMSRPQSERFYRGLADLARTNGWMRLCVLLVSERLVAFQWCLDYQGRRILLKLAYDEQLKQHSPGKVLQWMVLQNALAQGLQSYAFGGNAEDWKMHWTRTTRPRVTGIRFATRGPARLVGHGLKMMHRLLRAKESG